MKTNLPAKKGQSRPSRKRLGRVYDRLVFWLYERPNEQRARLAADELDELLAAGGADAMGAIFTEECRSLIHEARGEFPKAIERREEEIALIHQLHEMANGTSHERFALRQYTRTDLRDRLSLLAILCHEHGNPDKAIETLRKAKQYCQSHGVEFEDEDLLAEYSPSEASKSE